MMNERIKQLANIWANRRAEDEKLGIVYTFSEPALEQFAELIVEECAKRAEAYAYMSPNFNALAEELRRMIGVEE